VKTEEPVCASGGRRHERTPAITAPFVRVRNDVQTTNNRRWDIGWQMEVVVQEERGFEAFD